MNLPEVEKQLEQIARWAETVPADRHDITLLVALRDGVFEALAAAQGLLRKKEHAN